MSDYAPNWESEIGNDVLYRLEFREVCPHCGGTLLGDGYTEVVHCEFAEPDDLDGVEADGNPVYCRWDDCADDEVNYVECPDLCTCLSCQERWERMMARQWKADQERKARELPGKMIYPCDCDRYKAGESCWCEEDIPF